MPYKLEDYKDLVEPLGLWPFPRGHHNGLTRVPVGVSHSRLPDLFCLHRTAWPHLPVSVSIPVDADTYSGSTSSTHSCHSQVMS